MSNHKISVKAQPGLLGGAALLAFTAISWGGLLQVAKPMLIVLDPFWLNTIRYALSVPAFAAVLFLREGKAGLRFEGRFLRLMLFGTVGFAGFGIVTLLGVRGTRPEHAALIVATMPLVTAAVGWVRGAGRPPAFTLACMLTALVTVFAGEGEAVLTSQIFPDHAAPRLSLFSEGANAEVADLEVWTLSSIWTVPK